MSFDNGYQLELLSRMVFKTFMERNASEIHADSFDANVAPVVEEVLNRWRKTKKVLTSGQLRQLCQRHKVRLSEASGDGGDFDAEELRRFATERAYRDALAEAHVQLERGEVAKIKPTIEAAEKGRTPSKPPLDVLREPLEFTERQGLIATGIPALDSAQCLKGGVGAGEIAVLLAPTSGGKTSLLVYLAGTAVLAKKKVYYVTLEVPREDIYRKLQSRLSGKEEPSKKEWDKVRKKIKGTWWLEGYEPGTLSVSQLEDRVPKDVDLILVDYADYLKPKDGAFSQEYNSLGALYVDLKGLGMRRNCPVWTASQVNREGYGKTDGESKKKDNKEALIFLHHVADSMKKVHVCDQAISINQADVEQLPDPKTGNCTAILFVAKNRHGPRYNRIPITVNWAKCEFREGRFS